MPVIIEPAAPLDLAAADLRPRGTVHPSPADWRDQVIYFLLPDRFSDGHEAERPRFDRTQPALHRAQDTATWMAAGKQFVGGTLRGITSKLDYLRDLGVTALWVGPIWKQRADLQTYHGYAIQNFLDVDPRFGTRQDLRDLVDAAHERGLYVLLDVIYNHSGNNWFYRDEMTGQPRESLAYRPSPRYPFHSWRSGSGQPTPQIGTLEDGVYPHDFQNPDWYTRAGQILHWDPAGWEDPFHPDTEFRRGDFYDLKDLNHEYPHVLDGLIRVYQYWIALTDCDGFRIDTVKHISEEASQEFCTRIREYCESIGKENFWMVGEVTGGEYLQRSYLDIWGRDLDAILDIGESKTLLRAMCKGLGDPQAFFARFSPHDILGSHRETGRYHVSLIDDHDMVGAAKRRFAAGVNIPARYEQVAHAVGAMLLTLGVPCVYYGTEQAFDGTQDRHDFSIEPNLYAEDRYIREAMFGGAFGAFKTEGCHFFDPDHPTYLRIAALNRVRSRQDVVGLALRRGRQYLRETAPAFGQPFVLPRQGDIVAWSRLLFETEALVVLNSHGLETRSALVTVDATLHAPGTLMTVLYDGAWSDDQLRQPPTGRTVTVESFFGRSFVRVELPPSGMLVLG